MIIAWFIDCIKNTPQANRRIAYVRPHRHNVNLLLTRNQSFPSQIHIRFNEKCWYNIMKHTQTHLHTNTIKIILPAILPCSIRMMRNLSIKKHLRKKYQKSVSIAGFYQNLTRILAILTDTVKSIKNLAK